MDEGAAWLSGIQRVCMSRGLQNCLGWPLAGLLPSEWFSPASGVCISRRGLQRAAGCKPVTLCCRSGATPAHPGLVKYSLTLHARIRPVQPAKVSFPFVRTEVRTANKWKDAGAARHVSCRDPSTCAFVALRRTAARQSCWMQCLVAGPCCAWVSRAGAAAGACTPHH